MEKLTEQRSHAASTQHTTLGEHLLPVANWRPLHCEQNLRVRFWELLCLCRIFLENVEMRVIIVYVWKV